MHSKNDITSVSSARPAASFPELATLSDRIDHLIDADRPRYRRLWMYFRNPLALAAASALDDSSCVSARPYRQAQEWGLPRRITGMRTGSDPNSLELASDGLARKEIVIENDIGWRVEAMVDYLFGKAIVITSAASDPTRRETISELLRLILAQNGGILFLQQLALLGSVYGFVDVLVKLDTSCTDAPSETLNTSVSQCGVQQLGQPPAQCNNPSTDSAGPSTRSSDADANAPADDDLTQAVPASEIDASSNSNPGASHPSPAVISDERVSQVSTHADQLAHLARRIRLEVVEPARALPFLNPLDYRIVDCYSQTFDLAGAASNKSKSISPRLTWFEKLIHKTARHLAADRRSALIASDDTNRPATRIVELITATEWRRYENGALAGEGANSLGQIPLVHMQNTSVPFEYGGASDVEPLLPLQDELNTRLSDRAHRITMQSFKMYLGKGIENFNSLPVAPGRMWMSDNEDADVQEFGGDASCPSEDAHIADMREAIDKTSGVSPIAAGAIKGRIGRLTSAAALRVTMQALLAKTDKKRTTYGTGIARMCELALAWLDTAGLFATTADERRIDISWPSPLPENELEKLQEAESKVRLGVSREIVLRELGY